MSRKFSSLIQLCEVSSECWNGSECVPALATYKLTSVSSAHLTGTGAYAPQKPMIGRSLFSPNLYDGVHNACCTGTMIDTQSTLWHIRSSQAPALEKISQRKDQFDIRKVCTNHERQRHCRDRKMQVLLNNPCDEESVL